MDPQHIIRPVWRVTIRACDERHNSGRHVELTFRVTGHISDAMREEYELAIARRFQRIHGDWPARVGVGALPWIDELDQDAA